MIEKNDEKMKTHDFITFIHFCIIFIQTFNKIGRD